MDSDIDVKKELKRKLEKNLRDNLKGYEKECFVCKEKVIRPFATLILRNPDEYEEDTVINFCNPCCLQQDQIETVMHILTNNSDEFFANKFKEIAELRLEVLERNDKMTIAQDKMLGY